MGCHWLLVSQCLAVVKRLSEHWQPRRLPVAPGTTGDEEYPIACHHAKSNPAQRPGDETPFRNLGGPWLGQGEVMPGDVETLF